MKPTKRGWGALAVVGFCLLMAWGYGARSLNALVAPLVVVLLAAAIAVYRTDRPSLTREPIEEGFVGEERTVDVDVAVDAPTAAIVRDRVDDGLSARGNVAETTLTPEERFSYEIALEARGKRTIGPASLTVQDVLGLLEREFDYRGRDSVLVYPRVYDLFGASRHDLRVLADAVREHNREEFDHLREYVRGDSLRDIHWKSTAKRADDELVVKEFVAEEDLGAVEVVAESTAGRDDEMAVAAASVATFLLEIGVAVGITTGDERREPGTGHDHHVELLRLLAVAPDGEVGDRTRERADVLIRADDDGTVVVVDGHEIPFERLRGEGLRRSITGDDREGAVRDPTRGPEVIA